MKKIVFFFILITTVAKAQLNLNDTNNEELALQRISVTIGGDFFVNGSFPALMTERVDDFLTRIFTEVKQTTFTGVRSEGAFYTVQKEFSDFALRNIKVKRFDGEELKVDLKKFRLNGDFKNNPYLRNGDVIVIPPLDIETNFVEITGAVNKPDIFQFVEGDMLNDAIEFAMGINKSYQNVDTAEISRLSYDGQHEEIIRVGINDEFRLEVGDRIRIIADKTNKMSYKVLVLGEVLQPGYIFITKNKSTLGEVIKKAGGLTKLAWLKKGQIIRGISAEILERKEPLLEMDLKEMLRNQKIDNFIMGRMSDVTPEDTLYFEIENELRALNEMGFLDLSGLDDENSKSSNIKVKDGDVILIPEFENVVNVFGQVPNTGKYEYIEGKDYMYYVDRAGGFGEEADEDVMLIKGNSKNWIPADDDDVKIEPGDYIWIPKVPQRGLSFYLKNSGNLASIISTIATILLLINQLSK